MRIAVLSDTHNLLRPEVGKVAKAADLILHAGDICNPELLETLREWAPLHAVRGNNDRGTWAEALPHSLTLSVNGLNIVMIHDLKECPALPDSDTTLVISGHSHKPHLQKLQSVWYLNPGSAGPRRFKLPTTFALVDLWESQPQFHFIHLG